MKDLINPRLNVDDRIVLIAMPGEDAVTYGDRGTVIIVNNASSFIQYFINWDNGSTLALIEDLGDPLNTIDRWMYEENFDKIIKRKKITESDRKEEQKKIIDNRMVFTKFDYKFLFEYLEKLRESGIINMFGAAPFLYMGGQRIHSENHFNENKDEEAFEELVEMADEAKDKMIQGAIKVLEKEGKEIELGTVSRVIQRYATKILDMWMTTYDWK